MFNQVLLTGRLVKNAEMIQNKKNIPMCKMTLAVQKPFRNADGTGPDVVYIDVTLWHGIAESVVDQCKKGDLVMCKGRLETGKYQTKNGEKITKLEVIADNVIFLSKSKKNYEIGNQDNEADLEELDEVEQ